MRTLHGVVGAAMIFSAIYLCPADHDPQIIALRATSQALILFGFVFLTGGGVMLIMRSIFLEVPIPADKAKTLPQDGDGQ